MKKIIYLIKNDLGNILKSRVLVIVYVAIALMISTGLAVLFSIIFISKELKAPSPDTSSILNYLSMIMYIISLTGIGMALNSLAFQSLTREKASGRIECLLATPLKARDILISRSIAVFIPGFFIVLFLNVALMLVANYVFFIPRGTGFIFSPVTGLIAFGAIPLLYFAIILLTHLLGLFKKTANANVIAQIFFPALIALTINLILNGVVYAASWIFMAAILALSVIILVIVIIFSSKVSMEKIVLSGRA
jgi:ABC-type transport system involved in multi-copper enzyme maturation permease subunit